MRSIAASARTSLASGVSGSEAALPRGFPIGHSLPLEPDATEALHDERPPVQDPLELDLVGAARLRDHERLADELLIDLAELVAQEHVALAEGHFRVRH